MREIKFRYIAQQRETGRFSIRIFSLEEIERGLCQAWYDDLQFSWVFTKWALVSKNECTGLKDKNGKEIYEGDILRVSEENPVIYDVVWHEDAAKFCLHEMYQGRESWLSPFARVRAYEVIGNIYEHNYLLDMKAEK